MNRYSISEMEQLSGINAHTLRKWELRYGLLSPGRTATNIRYYTNDDLRKLLNVKTLLNGGGKISKLSKHSRAELNSRVQKTIEPAENESALIHSCISNLLLSAMDFDEARFSKAWLESTKHLGVLRTMTDVIYPLLSRVGLFWASEKMNPAQEHFLSCLVRRKLLSAIDELKTKSRGHSRWLLFLHEEEDHEIPLMLAHYLLAKHGAHIIYLGAKVPFENLKQTVTAAKPTHLLTFFSTRNHDKYLREFLSLLVRHFPKQKIFAGAGKEYFNKIRVPEKVKLLHTPGDLLSLISSGKKIKDTVHER